MKNRAILAIVLLMATAASANKDATCGAKNNKSLSYDPNKFSHLYSGGSRNIVKSANAKVAPVSTSKAVR